MLRPLLLATSAALLAPPTLPPLPQRCPPLYDRQPVSIHVIPTDQDPVDPQPIDLSELIPQQIQVQPFDVPNLREMLDVNDDGVADFRIEWTGGRGPLSTYYTTDDIVAIGDNRILKGGRPLEPGETITPADLLNGITHARLHTVGGSLRLLDEPVTSFSAGPFYNVDHRALALAIHVDGRIAIGYILVSVDQLGTMTIHEKRFEYVDEPVVTISSID